MTSTYFPMPEGVLLLDGESGKCVVSVPAGGTANISSLVSAFEEKILDNLQQFQPSGRVHISAIDNESAGELIGLRFRVEGENFSMEGVLDNLGEAIVYLKPGQYKVSSADENWVGNSASVTIEKAGEVKSCGLALVNPNYGEDYAADGATPVVKVQA